FPVMCLISRQTVHLGISTDFGGNPVNQALSLRFLRYAPKMTKNRQPWDVANSHADLTCYNLARWLRRRNPRSNLNAIFSIMKKKWACGSYKLGELKKMYARGRRRAKLMQEEAKHNSS